MYHHRYYYRTVLRALVGAKKTSTPALNISDGTDNSRESDDELRIVENSDSSQQSAIIASSASKQTTDDTSADGHSSELSKLLMTGFSGSSSDSTAAGAYETVLVILQDLSAMELEEAFDHVDIVCKSADTASVRVDGV